MREEPRYAAGSHSGQDWLSPGAFRAALDGALARREARRGLRRLIALASWLYLGIILVLWLLLQASDEWWPATILMYGPRWALAVPPAVLLLSALVVRPRLAIVSLCSSIVAVGPVMGLCLPWRTFGASESQGFRLRVFSCNAHYNHLDAVLLRELIVQHGVDMLVLQGYPKGGPVEPLDLDGWQVRLDNELYCASRYPIGQVAVMGEHSAGRKGAVARYELETPIGVVHFINLHLATPRKGLDAVLAERRAAIAEIEANSERRQLQSDTICQELGLLSGPVLIAGDFNTPTESTVYRHSWASYTNAFSTAGWGWGYTYRVRWTGVRIDHILAGPGWRCHRCRMGPEVGSPHRPLIVDLEWTGNQN
jgi:hypothetical protein